MRRVVLLLLGAAVCCGTSAAQPATHVTYLRSSPQEWSAGGSRLLFWSNLEALQQGVDRLDLFVVNADGSGLERMLPERADGDYLRAPDGRRVAFLRNDGALYSIDASGVEQDAIAAGVSQDGSVSPDGRAYAFSVAVSLKVAYTRIVEIPSGAIRGIGIGYNPLFSPDGGKLGVEDDDTVIVYDVLTGKQIFESYCCYNPQPIAFSPDGTRAAFSAATVDRGDDVYYLFVVDLRTGDCREIGRGSSIDSWSPDGSRLAFGGGYSIRADGSGRRRIFHPIPGFGFRLSPDWTRYAFTTFGPLQGSDLYIAVVGQGQPFRVSPSQCTVVTDRCLSGTSGSDRIRGGAGREVILGGLGSDVIDGRRGNDLVDGELAADVVRGGPGRDTLFGGYGNDVLRGDTGGDALRGGGGADKLVGGGGRDTLFGNPGSDLISGGPGADVVVADRYGDRDRITCGAGNDRVRADLTDRVAADCEHVVRRRHEAP